MTRYEARMFLTNPLLWVPCVEDETGRMVERTDLGLWIDRERAESIAMTHSPHMVHRRTNCSACAGTGWAETVEEHVCTACSGNGWKWELRQ